ncbi:MAG: adenylosuccinate synthetase [Methanopyri archaeon]|nr:adenylosuccinate synthetase [Methanopyri archaeon]
MVAGGQWGDEGKGKVVAYLSVTDDPDVVARAGVGPNAGHTVRVDGKDYGLRQVPCGFPNTDSTLAIGPGVLVNPDVLLEEVEKLSDFNVQERLVVDERCAVIEDKHIEMEASSKHLSDEINTTGTGCGPANADRALRKAKLARDVPELEPFLDDVPGLVNETLDDGGTVLVEGTQGFGLSLYHGIEYPYVTSKDTTASAFASDVGIGPTRVDEVYVVFKSYATRVGEGPFPTELSREEVIEKFGKEILEVERGTVTGRPRRIGEFDFEMAKRACVINGATQVVLTCLDRRFPDAAEAQTWHELPNEAKKFVRKVEEATGVPVTLISTGPEIEHTVDLR